MTNRVLRTFFAAWLGLTFSACEVVDDASPRDDIGTTEKESLGEVHAALSSMARASVVDTHRDGTPAFIKGSLARVERGNAAEALRAIAPAFRLNANDLVFKRSTVDAQGNEHIRYTQTLNGREVVGGELILHVDASGRVFAANSSARGGNAPAVARISEEAAARVARISTEALDAKVEGSRLVYVRPDSSERLHLAHAVRVTGETPTLPVNEVVFVDAEDGSVLLRASDIHTAMNRAVYHGNNTTSLPGTLKRSEGGAAVNDVHIDENYVHLGTTYNCYFENFARDSYTGTGAQLKSTVHHSTNYVNAFWNGTQMVYGDGNNVDSGMLGRDLDVTVHELTHAVTDSESDLIYSNESGALNEGMSDIFAAYCESWNRPTPWTIDADIWKIGEDIWTPGTAGDALRYMANPTQDGSSKDYYPTRYTGSSDNGGVHWNSGIANLAFQLLSQGGSHPRGVTTTVVTGIGVQKAGAIFYRANTTYFTASTTFAQAKTHTEQAAADLYPGDAVVADAVKKAWEAVGVGIVVPPAPTVTLSDGVTLTNLSAATGTNTFYKLTVPAGQASLKFTTSGGTGDVDMYVKFGSQPNSTTYDCRPYTSGNAETCNFTNPAAGDWYVMLNAYSAYSGLSLLGDYATTTTPPTGDTLVNAVATAPYSGATASWKCWTLTVPAGKTKVVFAQAGGTGDADLYVRAGAAPTTSTYACRPYLSGNTETCTINSPPANTTYYACSYGFSAYTNTTMKGTY